MADYGKDIINILLQAPQGLSVRKIVRHVYNAHNTFFEHVELEDVRRDVTAYLQRKSKTASSLIERTDTRGVYRLNLESADAQELSLKFTDEPVLQEDKPEVEDDTPDLFSGFTF